MVTAKIFSAFALCVALCAAGGAPAAPLKVNGRFLQDTHGNNILMRGVNLPVYKSGYADDLDAVAAAIALTQTNAVRLEWWAVPLGGQTEYSVANLDRAIQKFYDLGIIPIVELHDLTFGTDRTVFANTITAFWTRPDVVAILVKHQDHLVVNLANEWGDSAASADFLQNYTDAIAAIRNAGVIAPLMVDAPKGFEYQYLLDHGAALLALDPQSNTLLSVHAYYGAGVAPPYYTDAQVNTLLDALMNSGLPIVLGEASSRAWVNNPCDPINYANLLGRANTDSIGYLFWAWYEDGQCGQDMNITAGADGVTLPTLAGFGYDAIHAPAYGIDAAQPPTQKADFSPVTAALLNTSFGYNVTSTNDGATRAATAQVTRLNNLGADRRPVVVVMPGWGGVGDVAAAQDAMAIMFANAGYIALNIGFHQTSDVPAGAPAAWYSDLSESAKAALDALCALSYADCSAVVLTGESYGGTQIHPVVRYLRALGTYDGSAGGNAGRKVVALLGQDSGYTLNWAAPVDADATAYSIAMIENLGDAEFPVDSCDFGNCGARNRADYHQGAPGSQYVLSYCPAGGSHGSRGFANWDAWVLSAVKTMLHNQRAVPKFTGYVEPALAVSNACLTSAADLSLTQTATPNPAGTGKDVVYAVSVSNAGPVNATTVTLTDTIPPGTSFIWASPGCANAAGTVTCNLGTLASGASAAVKVVVRPPTAGSITNNASVSAAQGDPNSGNNTASSTITVNASPAAVQVLRYRLYSDVTKEHHFTTDLNEYTVLGTYVGTWVQEGTVGKVLNNPGSFGGVTATPYYRLYDNSTRWHHWTTDANEYYTLGFVYSGWNMEGVDGWILPTSAPGTTQLYRLNYPYLGSLHHWTIDANEYNTLIGSYGWIGEGGSGFVIQ